MFLTRALCALTLVLLVWPRAATAQIYMSRDANGNMVLSDRPIENPTKVFEVPGAPTFRATRPPSARAARFESLVQEYATRESLPADLVRAVIQVESGFNPHAVSRVGAMGLMQLMPATARRLGVKDPFDPAQNIAGGTRYLRHLLDKFQGDRRLALAAYNAGPGAVEKYGNTVPPYRETKDYVAKIGSITGTATGRDRDIRHAGAAPGKSRFYKTTDIVDGRPIVRISTERPASGTYEIIDR